MKRSRAWSAAAVVWAIGSAGLAIGPTGASATVGTDDSTGVADPTDPVAAAARVPADLVPARSSIRVEPVGSPRISRIGGTAEVQLQVTNTGPDARAVTVRYRLPDNTELRGTNCAAVGREARCAVGDLTAAATRVVSIGLRSTAGPAGPRSGVALPALTSGWDPEAGEILASEWDHEMGTQGEPLTRCWPLENSAPTMDRFLAAGQSGCDGVNDQPAASPDRVAVVGSITPELSERVNRSWEFRTAVTLPGPGVYRACLGVDDGGYLALTPSGRTPSVTDIVAEAPAFGVTVVGRPLVVGSDGASFDVLIRIANRGSAGYNNGGAGPGGWSQLGVVADGTACSPIGLGTSTTAWNAPGSTVPLLATPTVVLDITGTVSDRAGTFTQARVANTGPDNAQVVTQLTPMSGRVAVSEPRPFALAAGAVRTVSSALRPGPVTTQGRPVWTMSDPDSADGGATAPAG